MYLIYLEKDKHLFSGLGYFFIFNTVIEISKPGLFTYQKSKEFGGNVKFDIVTLGRHLERSLQSTKTPSTEKVVVYPYSFAQPEVILTHSSLLIHYTEDQFKISKNRYVDGDHPKEYPLGELQAYLTRWRSSHA